MRRPDWTRPPRPPDRAPGFRWWPLVTFWQTSADLVDSLGVPTRYGHNFGSNVVDGWVALHRPAPWTDADTARLRALVYESRLRWLHLPRRQLGSCPQPWPRPCRRVCLGASGEYSENDGLGRWVMPGLRVAERHNSSVDERLADLGLCGQTHLPSGRVCVLTAQHSGGCLFVAREQAELFSHEDQSLEDEARTDATG